MASKSNFQYICGYKLPLLPHLPPLYASFLSQQFHSINTFVINYIFNVVKI